MKIVISISLQFVDFAKVLLKEMVKKSVKFTANLRQFQKISLDMAIFDQWKNKRFISKSYFNNRKKM